MERVKIATLLLLAILVVSLGAAISPVAASGSAAGSLPQVTTSGSNMMITTDNYTVIFRDNGSMPSFVWWANNDPTDVYVVQYQGLIEYAQLSNSTGFLLKDEAEGTLLISLINEANQIDKAELNTFVHGVAIVGGLDSALTVAEVAIESGAGNGSHAVSSIQKGTNDLQNLEANITNANVTTAIDQSVTDLNAAITAINTGNDPQAAISTALNQLDNVTTIALNAAEQAINDRIAAREQLVQDAANFHPAGLAFSQTNWTVSSISDITDGNGNPIGITFNFTLVDAPPKFDFAENNVQLVIKIYSEPVVVQTSTQDGSYSYSLAGGEMKMDLIINNWDWNFVPGTIKLLNSTELGISPGLALQVDASTYNVTQLLVQRFMGDLSNVTAPVASQKAVFSEGPSTTSISYTGQSSDASQLNYNATSVSKNIAGKILQIISSAKLTLNNETTLGGFFEFVPCATVTNSSGSYVVNVSAAYYEDGNHLRLYITYPYFNGTLDHDPSIGVQNPTGSQSPSYIITQGPTGAIISILQIPTVALYPTFFGAGIAAAAVLLGAVVIIIAVRRRPTIG
jgi:hypothetical protein